MSSPLLHELALHGAEVSRDVLDTMYRDPFWNARFAARGRHHSDEDSAFHLQYLARAVETKDGDVMVHYACWLRTVLASRGMCTRHLAENFRLLSVALGARRWPGVAEVQGYLAEARVGLLYPEGSPRSVQDLESRWPDSTRLAYCSDPANWLSYLADALAFGKPDTLLAHARWTAAWMSAGGEDLATLAATLQSVRQLVEQERVGGDAVAYMDEALASLAQEVDS